MTPESKENMAKQATVFETVMKKCHCKKSKCKNGRCACYNTKQNCTSFCECEDCCNPFAPEVQKPSEESDSDEEAGQDDVDDVPEEYPSDGDLDL